VIFSATQLASCAPPATPPARRTRPEVELFPTYYLGTAERLLGKAKGRTALENGAERVRNGSVKAGHDFHLGVQGGLDLLLRARISLSPYLRFVNRVRYALTP
jgi:hypothetical protein